MSRQPLDFLGDAGVPQQHVLAERNVAPEEGEAEEVFAQIVVVLDVHGESTSTWAASDALCAGLQINNHLQDCGKDYKNLNRVYLPRDALSSAGASFDALGAERASPQLLKCLHLLAARTEGLLDQSRSLAAEVKDFRLGLEISVIQAFAEKIVRLLKSRDPLSQRVHLGPAELLAQSVSGLAGEITRRAIGRGHVSKPAAGA